MILTWYEPGSINSGAWQRPAAVLDVAGVCIAADDGDLVQLVGVVLGAGAAPEPVRDQPVPLALSPAASTPPQACHQPLRRQGHQGITADESFARLTLLSNVHFVIVTIERDRMVLKQEI